MTMPKTSNSATPGPERRYSFEYDVDGDRELGTMVANAVASVTESTPEEAADSLVRTVDPESLDRLFHETDEPANIGGRLVLSVDGSFVTVSSTGELEVEP